MKKISRSIHIVTLAAAVSLFTCPAAAAPAGKDGRVPGPLKVLMIGNSFSICVLREMPKVAADMGQGLDLCSMYIGGCTLERHARNIDAAGKKPYSITWSYTSAKKGSEPFRSVLSTKDGKGFFSNIPEMLSADRWDIVTIQQGSHASWRIATYEPHGTKIINEIRKRAPQARIYVQQTWTYTPWDTRLAKWKIDQNVMFDRLEDAYGKFARSHSLPQIYMGEAVQRYRRELPVVYTEKTNDDDVCGTSKFEKDEKTGRWRPAGDVFHLNKKGEFLQALVWTARIFDVDVTKSRYVPQYLSKQPGRVALMRRIASDLRKQK